MSRALARALTLVVAVVVCSAMLLAPAASAEQAQPSGRPTPATDKPVAPPGRVVSEKPVVKGRRSGQNATLAATGRVTVYRKNTGPSVAGALPSADPVLVCDRNLTLAYNYSLEPRMVRYWGSISCPIGNPSEMDLFFYEANVNTPDSTNLIDSHNYFCALSNPCETTHYEYLVFRTARHLVSGYYYGVGTDGLLYYLPPNLELDWYFNDQGRGYPLFDPSAAYGTGPGPIPFPSRPWNVCDDDPTQFPPCYRDPNFADNLRAYYQQRGWGYPVDAEAHHIKPLAFGGGNNATANGVFLAPPDHQMFTTWWDQFSTRAW